MIGGLFCGLAHPFGGFCLDAPPAERYECVRLGFVSAAARGLARQEDGWCRRQVAELDAEQRLDLGPLQRWGDNHAW